MSEGKNASLIRSPLRRVTNRVFRLCTVNYPESDGLIFPTWNFSTEPLDGPYKIGPIQIPRSFAILSAVSRKVERRLGEKVERNSGSDDDILGKNDHGRKIERLRGRKS